MKNLKKILALVLLLGVMLVAFAVSSIADEEYKGTMERLNALVAEIDSSEDKGAALESVVAYIPTVDPASEGYDAAVATVKEKAVTIIPALVENANPQDPKAAQASLVKADALASALELEIDGLDAAIKEKAILVAKAYLDAVADETVSNTATNQIALNKFNAFVKLGYCDDSSDEYVAMMADAAQREALQAEAKEANRQAMLAQSTLSDYSLDTMIETRFDDNTIPMDKDIKNVCTIESRDGALHIITRTTDPITAAYVQKAGLSKYTPKGMVIDFDFTSFGTMTEFHFEAGGHESLQDGSRVYPSYFRISKEGDIKTGDGDGNKLIISDAIASGEWLHFTVIFDPDKFEFSLYCEYQLLKTYTAKPKGTHTVNLNIVRFATSTTPNGHHAFDNIFVYQGTALRDIGMFERMSAEEKFVYYTNYYTDDTRNDTLGRYNASKNIEAMLPTYQDADGNFIPFAQGTLTDEEYAALTAEVQAAIEKLETFDASAFIENLKVSNREQFVGYVANAKKLTRELTAANVTERLAALATIDEFLLTIEGNIDETGEDYKAAIDAYTEISKLAHMDENILAFNKYIEIYQKVETLNSLRKYYNFAKAIFEDEAYPIDPNAAELEGFETFKAAYAVYVGAADRIAQVEKDQNAKKIVSCYGLVSHFDKSEWEANYDYMNQYVVMIRETIAAGYYNPDYPEIDTVIMDFKEMDEFFYALLQQAHINELTARLEYIKNSSAYIEKAGTISYIERYIASNDIDKSIPEIKTLLANFETAKMERDQILEDYPDVLTQNAAYFVALVEKMRISNDFNEKKELHDMATDFYFALDASYPGADKAIAVYDEHTSYFKTAEVSSKRFLDAVVILRAATTEDEKFAALVDCYIYSLDAEITYSGVKEAMEYYEVEYNAYSNAAHATIDAIEGVGVTVGSVRANCGVKAVIAVIIKKIFG